MPKLHSVMLPVCLVAAAASPAFAQNEPQLRDAFEGKSVRVKIDMPATQLGIDVYPDARRAVDFTEYAARVKANGIAIRNGDSVIVTRVRVKEKLIEFHLAGGGYGTFGDDTDTSVYVPSTPKSNREKDLEKLVRDEKDAARKRQLQRELDDLRNRREREDARNKTASAAASEAKRVRIANDRLHSGSRFNIRYDGRVPTGLGPDGVMRALEDYVEFTPANQQIPPKPQGGEGGVRKGMTFAEAQQVLGKPDRTSERNEGTLRVTTATFTRNDQVITAEFVEGILIKYSIASR